MPFTFTPKSRKTRYSIQTVLKGHLGPVICLSATDDGKLASGGEYFSLCIVQLLIEYRSRRSANLGLSNEWEAG